ncbi:diadenylate cyclase [Paenibacillus sp. PsM32]|uniref:diadenylate cyclase n=1 Tax=Paenibacillus sp. PsM32 TaxID=3030536 RepID=UPI00263AA6F9|nr:diadenylate cyclase [Paenibacillus sp. PsM32]MDN4616703.1 diadenylate cyclase [Paenibacillus sp. PsM32]
MIVNRKNINSINEIIYKDLNSILKKLDKKLHLKIYCVLPETKNELYKVIRIKKTLANGFIHEDLKDVYKELNIESFKSNSAVFDYDFLKSKLDGEYFQLRSKHIIKSEVIKHKELKEQNSMYESSFNQDLLYTNQLYFHRRTVSYILMIRNVDNENQEIFYNSPEISFFRMLLDYFFLDYYTTDSSNKIIINDIKDNTIPQKYNEDCIQYNRRIARLYFGKIQTFIESSKSEFKLGIDYLNSINSQFYVNNLLESLDDVSSRAYESSIAFGSILFMNKSLITESNLIRFAIKFAKNDVIKLEDAKRIRKLLELTNIEKDLYLIADHSVIYGIGEVNWHLQKDSLILRLDFNGVSKYILSFAKLQMQSILEGQLITKENQKFYRSDLKLEEKELISIAFKNPKINEEGYSTERFSRILSKELFENKEEQIKIEKLNEIVQKARMQKHGTIVVITNVETAKNEIKKLSKQSTVIEMGPINPEHIKFLTSIDGAIYFDSDCNCHGIGVILDGEAQENIGDASRGARFNSAYRYIAKLKKSAQRCVIIIISEDGMIDILPEFEDEDKLLEITEEIIDLIKEGKEDCEEMIEKESTLLDSPIVDNEWLFRIATTYYNLENHVQANKYYVKAIENSKKEFIDYKYYHFSCMSSYSIASNLEEILATIKLAKKLNEQAETNDQKLNSNYILSNCFIKKFNFMGDASSIDEKTEVLKEALIVSQRSLSIMESEYEEPWEAIYSTLGTIYWNLAKMNTDKKEKNGLLNETLKYNTIAVELCEDYINFWDSRDYINFWNKGMVLEELGYLEEALQEFIKYIFFESTEKDLDKIKEILKENNQYIENTRSFYYKIATSDFKNEDLEKWFTEYDKTKVDFLL